MEPVTKGDDPVRQRQVRVIARVFDWRKQQTISKKLTVVLTGR